MPYFKRTSIFESKTLLVTLLILLLNFMRSTLFPGSFLRTFKGSFNKIAITITLEQCSRCLKKNSKCNKWVMVQEFSPICTVFKVRAHKFWRFTDVRRRKLANEALLLWKFPGKRVTFHGKTRHEAKTKQSEYNKKINFLHFLYCHWVWPFLSRDKRIFCLFVRF